MGGGGKRVKLSELCFTLNKDPTIWLDGVSPVNICASKFHNSCYQVFIFIYCHSSESNFYYSHCRVSIFIYLWTLRIGIFWSKVAREKGISKTKSKQQNPCSNCMHWPVTSWGNACSTYMHASTCDVHELADAYTYCMGSKASSLSRIYLYSCYFVFGVAYVILSTVYIIIRLWASHSRCDIYFLSKKWRKKLFFEKSNKKL